MSISSPNGDLIRYGETWNVHSAIRSTSCFQSVELGVCEVGVSWLTQLAIWKPVLAPGFRSISRDSVLNAVTIDESADINVFPPSSSRLCVKGNSSVAEILSGIMIQSVTFFSSILPRLVTQNQNFLVAARIAVGPTIS